MRRAHLRQVVDDLDAPGAELCLLVARQSFTLPQQEVGDLHAPSMSFQSQKTGTRIHRAVLRVTSWPRDTGANGHLRARTLGEIEYAYSAPPATRRDRRRVFAATEKPSTATTHPRIAMARAEQTDGGK